MNINPSLKCLRNALIFSVILWALILLPWVAWGDTYSIDCGDGSGFFYEANSKEELSRLKEMFVSHPGWSVAAVVEESLTIEDKTLEQDVERALGIALKHLGRSKDITSGTTWLGRPPDENTSLYMDIKTIENVLQRWLVRSRSTQPGPEDMIEPEASGGSPFSQQPYLTTEEMKAYRDPEIKWLGLRSDGVVVWREKK